jgi:ATP-dependent DNA helicase RecQ
MELKDQLYKYFGYEVFREGQEDVIKAILSKKNVVTQLPTGTGKSVCFLLPGYMIEGLVIIVSPLLSLMEDQVQQLVVKGEKRVAAFNSFRTQSEKRKILESLQNIKFLYVSPEVLQSNSLIEKLKSTKIALVAIDEAHCISQWGHDFRTDYLKLGPVIKVLKYPPVLALTATANKNVMNDIISKLELREYETIIQTVNRKNILLFNETFNTTAEKNERLLQIVSKTNGPILIYCMSRDTTKSLYEYLRDNNIIKCAYYHGGLDTDTRILIQQQFMNSQIRVMCCTSAFGMGINKENVRLVIHYHIPSQIESYVQEIGRAGRDGNFSFAITLTQPNDFNLPFKILENEFPSREEIKVIINNLLNEQSTQNIFEVHVRVISYYLEIEKENFVNLDEKDIDFMTDAIYNKIKTRIKYKENKINQMFSYISTQQCRRAKVLEAFDEQLLIKQQHCCDNCGSILEDYFENIDINNNLNILNWEEELTLRMF